jgi:hypothetical protein
MRNCLRVCGGGRSISSSGGTFPQTGVRYETRPFALFAQRNLPVAGQMAARKHWRRPPRTRGRTLRNMRWRRSWSLARPLAETEKNPGGGRRPIRSDAGPCGWLLTITNPFKSVVSRQVRHRPVPHSSLFALSRLYCASLVKS